MTPNPLEEIQARADAATKERSAYVLAMRSQRDVPKLVAALRAVEAVVVKYSAVFETEDEAQNTTLAGILDDLEVSIREALDA